jgi:preprotein translocase SecF subunit
MATRTFLHLIVNTKFGENPALFGLRRQWVTGKSGRQLDIVGRMAVWFTISALVILPGVYFWLGAHGLKGGIDFTGGSLMQVEFQQAVPSSDIEAALDKVGLTGSMVQKSTENPKLAFVRTKQVSDVQYRAVKSMLETDLGGKIQSAERVGPTISRELTSNAVKAVLLSALAIVLYLSIRFAIGGLANGFRFGTCAIVATLHDVFVMIGIFAILGHFLNWEVDSLFVTALLTVIGFSTHDTIVIFDRIRENLRHRQKGEAFDGLVNKSILQSFARSINTSFTVVLTLVALMLLGAHNIKHFVIALLIGVITGTYSSIFNASQLLVLWQRFTEKQPTQGKVLAEPASREAKARELKPITEEAGSTSSPQAGSADEEKSVEQAVKWTEPSQSAAKAKAKKKKRRF